MFLTFFVICFALVLGIMIPDIEIVLGMVGSTMGSSICVIFPAAAFLRLTSKNTTERLAAQGVLVVGVITLILGTYVNLVEHTAPDPALIGQGCQQFYNKKILEVKDNNEVMFFFFVNKFTFF